ncbi:MAG: glycosyltransferase [Alteromonadaceae bacterium]|nr:glycosyltransferase [Alteromonadaceae bacterium]
MHTWFDPQWYLRQYPDVAQAGLDPWHHYQSHGVNEGRLPCTVSAMEWDKALWQQDKPRAQCVAELEKLAGSENPLEASFAGFALGRWHAWQGEWARAADALLARPQSGPFLPAHYGPALLEAEALTRSGRLPEARASLSRLQQARPDWPDALLAAANLLAAEGREGERLSQVNRVWEQAGLTTARLVDNGQPLTLDNLLAVAPAPRLAASRQERVQENAPLVSVIIPAFNAGDGLLTALQSLVNQSLAQAYEGALEVLLVNDASTDNTADLAEAFARYHSNVRVFHQPENAGAYAARNRGLAQARGQCITVHDADDWSHPQKLELQWRALEEHPHWLACNSHWVRCSPDMQFTRWRMEEGWVYRNISSLMFRREVFDALGFWDEVRVEADTEYYYRVRAAFGEQAMGEVLPGVPLAFGRIVPTALTVLAKTHLVTQFKGLRADYRAAAFAWHERAHTPSDLYMARNPGQRAFDAPAGILLDSSPGNDGQVVFEPEEPGFRVLFALSLTSGGTPQTNEDLMRALAALPEGPQACFVLGCEGCTLTLSVFREGQYRVVARHSLENPVSAFPHSSPEFDQVTGEWLEAHGIGLVHVRHSAYQSLGLIEAAASRDIPVVYSFHDYYAVCPSVKLLDENNQFCAGRCTAGAGECHQEIWPREQVMPLKHGSVYQWQLQFAGPLALCSGFVCTTGSVKEVVCDVFPALANKPFEVIPHGRDFPELAQLAEQPLAGEPFRILVPGHIAVSKGAEVLRKLAGTESLAHVEWHVLGTLQDGYDERMPANVIVHGRYKRAGFPAHVARIRPHAGAVFSIWPETWCHTLTELWAAGLPVFGFDTGAVGERIRETGAGWLAGAISADAMADCILQASTPEAWQAAVQQVLQWQQRGQRGCEEMAVNYLRLYNRVALAGL